MNKPKRYCTGIDCAWCGEKEPCIYRIANRLEEENVKLKAENKELRENLPNAIIRLMSELDQLKETNGSLLSIQYKLADSNTKLRQTLTEIKEIANLSIAHWDIDYLKQAINEILQKISECEVINE